MENKETFQARIKPYLPPSQQLDVKLAYCLAKFGHRAQTRKELTEGKPTRYFEHVRRVALVLMDEVKMVDRDMIIAALLHDSLEDCQDLTAELLEHSFGAEVVHIVTLLSKVPKEGYTERLSHCHDWKVLLIKACDRLDNLRSLMIPGTTFEFQKKQVAETRQYYFPIFDRMVQLAPINHYPNIVVIRDEIKRLVERYQTTIDIIEQKKKNACPICQGQGWYPAPDDENMVECFCQQPKEKTV